MIFVVSKESYIDIRIWWWYVRVNLWPFTHIRRHLHTCTISLIEDACVHKISLTRHFLLKYLFVRAKNVRSHVFRCYGYRLPAFLRFIGFDIGPIKKRNYERKIKNKRQTNIKENNNIIKQYINVNEKVNRKKTNKYMNISHTKSVFVFTIDQRLFVHDAHRH